MVKDKHLLSLKDMNQSDKLEQLLDAGASSFKIEGRLKDVSYVKNVTAAYRQKLDAIIARRPEYVRASSGTCSFEFKPQLDKSLDLLITSCMDVVRISFRSILRNRWERKWVQ